MQLWNPGSAPYVQPPCAEHEIVIVQWRDGTTHEVMAGSALWDHSPETSQDVVAWKIAPVDHEVSNPYESTPARVGSHGWLRLQPPPQLLELDTPVVVRGQEPRALGTVMSCDGDYVNLTITSDVVPVPRRVRLSRVRINLFRPAGVAAAIRLIYTGVPTAWERPPLGRCVMAWQTREGLTSEQLILIAMALAEVACG